MIFITMNILWRIMYNEKIITLAIGLSFFYGQSMLGNLGNNLMLNKNDSSIFQSHMIKISDHLTIYSETLGDISNEPLLLISGAGRSRLFWSDNFCKKLAQTGFFVIRYDARDVGKSSKINYEEHPYFLNDMVEDVLHILDYYDLDKVHIVGSSIGGFVGQIVASNHKKRIKSLTLVGTTLDDTNFMLMLFGKEPSSHYLPGPTVNYFNQAFAIGNLPSATDAEKQAQWFENSKFYFGQKVVEDFFDNFLDLYNQLKQNPSDLGPSINHRKAMSKNVDRTDLGQNITVSTLIIHGDKDETYSLEHAYHMVKNIPNSKLFIIKDMKHFICWPFEDQVVSILKNNILNL
jgi:pimeloyl-ACP methyl ester carboxylesterase